MTKFRWRAFLHDHDRMLIQIILRAKAKLCMFADRFCSILMPVALAIIPKLEFDFEVIMYIAIFFVSEVQKVDLQSVVKT